MKKFFTTLLFISFFATSVAVAKKSIKSKSAIPKWQRIMKLIDKEISSIQNLKKKGPRLQYRLFELFSEKIKLEKEKENADFLKSNGTKNRSVFFIKSQRMQRETESFGLNAIRSYPRYDKNSKIYYTLALNSRDYGSGKNIETYLTRALKSAPAGTPIIYKTKVALSEFFYNQKNYKKAVSYYKAVFGHKVESNKDQWLSKHHYNLAWCYLKIVNYQKAVYHLKQAYHYTKNKKYIEISEQIYNAVPLFFLYAGKTKQGVEFLISNVKMPASYLSKLATLTADRGSLKDAEYILDRAFEEAMNSKDSEEMFKLTLKKLEIYRNFKQNSKHYRTAKTLALLHKKYRLPKNMQQIAIEQLKGQVGYLQLRLKSNPEKKSKYLKPIIVYFDTLIEIDNENSYEYYYYQGETYNQAAKSKPALQAYLKAMNRSNSRSLKIIKDKSIVKLNNLRKKIVDAIFYTVEQAELSKSKKIRTYEKTYSFFLSHWPKEKRSEAIYEKLFNIYIKTKEDSKATKLFYSYRKNYPNKRVKQRGYAAHIIDYYVKNKNTKKLSDWIIRIDKGYLNFERSYIDKGLILLGQVLFENLEVNAKKGRTQHAIAGYRKLFNNINYPKVIHSRAALNIAILELEKANTKQTSLWVQTYVKVTPLDELKKNEHNLFSLLENILLLQDFKNAFSLSSHLLKKFCKLELKTKDKLYHYSATLPLFEKEYKESLNNLNSFKSCGISTNTIKDSISYLINYSIQNREYDFLLQLHQKEGLNHVASSLFIDAFFDFYWDAIVNQNKKRAVFAKNILLKKILRYPNESHSRKLSQIIHFEKFQDFSSSLSWNFKTNRKQFDQRHFNLKLAGNLKKLESFDGDAKKLLNYKHPIITLAVFENLYNSYNDFHLSLNEVKPSGMGPEFKKSFYKQINMINSSIKEKAGQYKQHSSSTSMQKGIFNNYGVRLTKMYELEKNYQFRYPAAQFLTPSNKIKIQGDLQ